MSLLVDVNEPDFEPLGGKTLDADSQWYAVQTRSRHEKMVAAQFDRKHVHSFLPLTKSVHRWSDRRKMIEEPLFGGYVFVRMTMSDDRRLAVLRTLGVVGFVGVQGQAISIPDKQIQDLQALLASNVRFDEFPFLRLGQRVRIRGGCLDGIEGILVSKNTDHSVVISVDIIQRSLEIRVSGFHLQVI